MSGMISIKDVVQVMLKEHRCACYGLRQAGGQAGRVQVMCLKEAHCQSDCCFCRICSVLALY
jgi:hypothetical protein